MNQTVIKLKLSGLHCEGCANGVRQALRGVSGVRKAKVDLRASQADVEVESDKVNAQDLVRAVEQAGFGAEIYSAK